MSDPTIDAARDVLAESLDKIRRGIAGLTVDQLNAKPAGGETNLGEHVGHLHMTLELLRPAD
jgi:hypothetical protein